MDAGSAYVFDWSSNLCPGDLNCDGSIDFADINPFVQYLTYYSSWLQVYPNCPPQNGDANGDGFYPSFQDINSFIGLLVESPTPCGY